MWSKGLDNLAWWVYNRYIKSEGDTPMKSVFYWDMDGVLADYHGYVKGNWSMALRRDTFQNLPAFQHNVDLLNTLLAKGITCYILTKAANEDAMQGKRDWLKVNVPMMDDEHFICITKGRKVDHMKEEGILIDDDATNCKQWTKAGYTAIYLETKGQEINL